MTTPLGVLGLFKSESEIIEAAKQARAKGFERYDAFTPYPVHGLDDAMGIQRSFLPWVTFVAGVTGTFTALALQIGTSAYDWPLNVGGKPLISLPAFIPITFELTVLFGGLATVGALFAVCGLPALKAPVLHPRITNDRFGLFIPATEKQFNENNVVTFLKGLKAEEVTVIKDQGA